MRLPLILLFITIFSNSCVSKEPSDGIKEIYSMAIDANVIPLPLPPPPEPGDDSGMPQHVRDSLKAIKLNIKACKSITLFTKERFFDLSKYKQYTEALDHLFANTNELLNMDNWYTERGHSIRTVNCEEVDKKELFKNYDALVTFSNVGFNSTKDKAVMLIIVSYSHYLSGSLTLLLLERSNDDWEIKEKDVISIA